jgi:tetratricopeptide (TPR) repeat protein
LLSVMGEGGMGVVYRARQTALKRLVALKMIASERASPAIRERFQTEAETIARLRHPNFVHIYDVGECDGRPYLALELVSGGSLADRLSALGPMSARDAAKLVSVLAHAMHHAHQQGIVHRDLKPANVLIAERESDSVDSGDDSGILLKSPVGKIGQLKISDFGLAKLLDADKARTQSGAIMGTPVYMAPEQAQGKGQSVGPATDVYSLGAILFESLTGRPPFDGESSWEVLMKVVGSDAPAPSRFQPRLSRDLDTICLKCLAKNPSQRYASAKALASDLDHFIAGEAIAARPERMLSKLHRRVRRRPMRVALAILTVGSLLLLGSFLQLRRTHAEDALNEGKDLMQMNAFFEARTRFDRGIQWIDGWPGCYRLRSDLKREAIAAELCRLSQGLMFGSDSAHLDSDDQRALVEACFEIWDQRWAILGHASDDNAAWSELVRAKLRDIALRGLEINRQRVAAGKKDCRSKYEEEQRLEELKAFGAPDRLLALVKNSGAQAPGNSDGVRQEFVEPRTAMESRQYGRAYWKLHRLDDAAHCFRIGLEMNPRDLALHFDQAALAFERGRFDTALASYTACLALHPVPTVYSRLGFTNLALADVAKTAAIEDLTRWDWQHGVEQLKQARRYLTHAQRDFDEAVKGDPDHAEARFGRGQARLRSNDYSQAIVDFTFALDNHYPPARALHGLAVAQLKTGLLDEARANLRESLRQSANREVQKLLEQMDQFVDAHRNLGLRREQFGRPEP